MQILKNYRVIIISVIILSSALFFIYTQKVPEATYSLTSPENTSHTVTLTEKGFEPSELTIRLGDKVIFDTNQNIPFWPASSLHPTHEIYPEFDPRERILPPENWEFVFTKIGSWKFHDHINAHAIGIIHVIDTTKIPSITTETTSTGIEKCQPLPLSEKQRCWDEQLSLILKEKGVKEAFKFFAQLYKTEPDVPKACHEWGHSLGEASYEQYKKTGELALTPEASYCGYGYFHSFIAELVKDTGDYTEVLKFCERVENELSSTLSNIHSNCVHGVGHGTTAWILESPENWGEFNKTASEGTAICERIYTNDADLEDCFDGVFNELHLDLFNDRYGMNFEKFMEKNDPFWLCQEQKDRHKQACYFEFVGIFWKIFDMDLGKAMQYVINKTENLEERGAMVVSKISADWIQFDIVNDSNKRNIEACRMVPLFLFDSCIQGIANGFIQHGDPENLHDRAFKFCRADYLTDEEEKACFTHFISMLYWNYDTEKFKTVCSTIDPSIRPEACSRSAREIPSN